MHINSWGEFEQRFGGLIANLELGYAVQQFFLNGGKDACIAVSRCRLVIGDPTIARLSRHVAAVALAF